MQLVALAAAGRNAMGSNPTSPACFCLSNLVLVVSENGVALITGLRTGGPLGSSLGAEDRTKNTPHRDVRVTRHSNSCQSQQCR